MSIADKLTTIAENVSKVYESGQQSEYDKMWDNLQASGALSDYRCSFGCAWNDTVYNPKYPIVVKNAESMYSFTRISEKKIEFNSSACTNFTKTFYYANCKYIGTVDCTAYKNVMQYTFSYATKLISIDKLILNEDNKFNNSTFQGSTNIESMIIEGVIGQNGFNVQWSTKLNAESIVSIIEALSADTTGLSVTLSQTAVNNMVFPITSAKTETTYNTWDELANTRHNWTISLV